MKSKPSLTNLARSALLLSLSLLFFLNITGCSSSTSPTYVKEGLEDVIPELCKNEYKLDVRAKLVGDTVWVYLPVEDMFVNSDKPIKSISKFKINTNQSQFKGKLLATDYAIQPIPEKTDFRNTKINKIVQEKINNVLKILMRVLLSLDRSKQKEPKFFVIVAADIKGMEANGQKFGFEIQEIFYYLDFKKLIYSLISVTEFQHRSPQDFITLPEIVGDKTGAHLAYKNFTMEDFLKKQIEYRVRMKFETPEVERNADVDKEILKIVTFTLKNYDYKNFKAVELNNLLTNNKVTLNRAAVWGKATEE